MTKVKQFGLLVAGVMLAASALQARQPDATAPKQAKQATGAKPAPKQAPSGIETAVLVLDGSGSMSTAVGSDTRMKVAQDAVQKLIDNWDADVPLGLTAYGHRGTGCGDIEALVPVQPVDKAAFMAKVKSLSPKGSTPLSEAVIQAAEQLDYENNQATVILVSDGEETCNADPCEMAKALEEKGVDLTVHVVGFGVDKTVGETKLACIAKNTGGQYKTASDAASLNQALTGMVKDVKERKKTWRKRCGKNWGKNGRWHKGYWKKGRYDRRHKQFWDQLRSKWKKRYGNKHHGKKWDKKPSQKK